MARECDGPEVGGAALREATRVTPLDVLLQVMQVKWQTGDVEGAASLARLTVGYVHGKSRQGGRELAGRDEALGVDELSDAQLQEIADCDAEKAHRPAARKRGVAAAAGD